MEFSTFFQVTTGCRYLSQELVFVCVVGMGGVMHVEKLTLTQCCTLRTFYQRCGKHFDLFPVQKEVIPAILESAQQGLLIGRGGYKPRDICVSAPTGSGKTLAFVIPVIQVSCSRPHLTSILQVMSLLLCVSVKKEHKRNSPDEMKIFLYPGANGAGGVQSSGFGCVAHQRTRSAGEDQIKKKSSESLELHR